MIIVLFSRHYKGKFNPLTFKPMFGGLAIAKERHPLKHVLPIEAILPLIHKKNLSSDLDGHGSIERHCNVGTNFENYLIMKKVVKLIFESVYILLMLCFLCVLFFSEVVRNIWSAAKRKERPIIQNEEVSVTLNPIH